MTSTNIDVAAVVVAAGEVNAAKDRSLTYEESVQFIDELTSKCDEIQHKVLIEILTQNVDTEYLKRHGMLHGHIDHETFKKNVPVITYEDIKPDILRIYNGDSSQILCAQPITELWVSFGASDGECKLIPATSDHVQRRHALRTTCMPFIKRRIEGEVPHKGKVFTLMMTNDDIITPGGLLARPYVNGVFKDPSFANIRDMYTCPLEAIHCSDHFQSIYTQLLCGIYKRLDVTKVKTIFSSTLIWAIQFLKTHYPKICRDISSGTLSPKITDTRLRSCMVETYMEPPQPTLAKFVETACIKENWEGILKIIWPNLKYVEAIVTGSMARYIPMLNHYSGGLPLVSAKYVSTECGLGFNLDPMCDPYNISYTILPNTAYYEFIPLKAGNDELGLQSKLIDMVNVEVGQEYELVVTTYSGLYRYRLGDVLQATGFYNSTPQFKFVRRTNEVLSIDADKTTESELQKVIEMVSNVLQPYNTVIVDYTSNACRKTIPGHYVIYLELKTESEANGIDANVLEKCCLAMEESLGLTYRTGRVSNCIGPIEIRVVSNGTFEKLRDDAISIGASFGQFKMPRCVTLLPMLELLDSRVVSSYFSPSVPHCHS